MIFIVQATIGAYIEIFAKKNKVLIFVTGYFVSMVGLLQRARGFSNFKSHDFQ